MELNKASSKTSFLGQRLLLQPLRIPLALNADSFIEISATEGISISKDGVITFKKTTGEENAYTPFRFANELAVKVISNGKVYIQRYRIDNYGSIAPGGWGDASISIVKGFTTPQAVTRRAAFHDRSAVGTNTYRQVSDVEGISVSETGDVTVDPSLPAGTYYVDVEVISGGKSTVVTLVAEVLPESAAADEDILSISYQRLGNDEITLNTGGEMTTEGALDKKTGVHAECEPWYRYDVNLRAGDRLVVERKAGQATYELREVPAGDEATQARFVNVDDGDDWIGAGEVTLDDGQSFENQWGVGTHSVKVTYAGHTTSFNVEIAKQSAYRQGCGLIIPCGLALHASPHWFQHCRRARQYLVLWLSL